jgi:hypothetical protein
MRVGWSPQPPLRGTLSRRERDLAKNRFPILGNLHNRTGLVIDRPYSTHLRSSAINANMPRLRIHG